MTPALRVIEPNDQSYEQIVLNIFARTIWGEVKLMDEEERKNYPNLCMSVIASIITNRLKISNERGGYWWGNDIVNICQKPYQFKSWNRSDPAYRDFIAVGLADQEFRDCLYYAEQAMKGELPDETDGATHYYQKNMVPENVKYETPCGEFGGLVFYRMVG